MVVRPEVLDAEAADKNSALNVDERPGGQVPIDTSAAAEIQRPRAGFQQGARAGERCAVVRDRAGGDVVLQRAADADRDAGGRERVAREQGAAVDGR